MFCISPILKDKRDLRTAVMYLLPLGLMTQTGTKPEMKLEFFCSLLPTVLSRCETTGTRPICPFLPGKEKLHLSWLHPLRQP